MPYSASGTMRVRGASAASYYSAYAPRARTLVAPHRGCAQRSRAIAPTLSTHSARDEKTYRAAQRTYLLVIVSCREVRLEVRDAL